MSETEHGIYFVEEIAKGIYKFYEQRNASIYLVTGKDKACLIDTAYGLTDLNELVRHYTDLPVTVVNTHGHIDHVLGDHWFDNAYLNAADRAMYNEIVFEFSMLINEPWVQDFYGDFVKNIDAEEVYFPAPENISEGDVIDLGGKKLEVHEMPGHTKGSIVLLDSAVRYFLYRDLVEAGAVGIITYDGSVFYRDRDIDKKELRPYVVDGAKKLLCVLCAPAGTSWARS